MRGLIQALSVFSPQPREFEVKVWLEADVTAVKGLYAMKRGA